jgi:hypothetical protein
MSDIIEEGKDLADDRSNVLDDAADDESSAPQTYNISSYGADFDVDGLVKRLKRGDIFIPPFQRDYVWNLSEASRFIESLLLGLPVPGVFLAKDPDTNKSLVIDGQQRLKTLQFFYGGDFNPKPDRKNRRIFKLLNVQPQFEGKTYDDLEERDRVRLNDTIIHATIVKQESPAGDDTSVYHVFERLNTGGRKLMPQEIRTAIFHGPLVDFLHKLNAVPSWRSVFGPESNRLKDKELILRFLALYFESDNYSKPMSEFLNKFSKRHRAADADFLAACEKSFTTTIDLVARTLGKDAFRPERSLNAAVFDSVMVSLARRLATGEGVSPDTFKAGYAALLAEADFKDSTSNATSDAVNLGKRIAVATRVMGAL